MTSEVFVAAREISFCTLKEYYLCRKQGHSPVCLMRDLKNLFIREPLG